MYVFYRYHDGVWDIWADSDYPLWGQYLFTKNECHWMVPGTYNA